MATRKKKKTDLAREVAAADGGLVDVQDVAALFVRLLVLLGFDHEVILGAMRTVGKPKRPRSIAVLRGSLAYWAQIVTRWTIDPKFIDANGHPRDLPFSGPGSFSELVKTDRPGEKPAQCRDILVATGTAIELANGRLRFRSRSMITNADLKAPVFADEFLRPLLSLLLILESGLRTPVTGLAAEAIQRSVGGIDLPEEDVPEFRAFVERHGMDFINAVDEWLSHRARERNAAKNAPGQLVRPYIGLYMTADSPAATPLRQKGRKPSR